LEEAVDSLIRMYSSWPEQFRRGYRVGSEGRIRWDGPVLFCGMGGSGSAGDFASIILEYMGRRGILGVYKGFRIPPWTGPDTLVVAVSYSGNTYETVSCAREALQRRAKVVAVTSGGILEKYSSKWGIKLIRVTSGLVPRAALAEMVGAIVGALEPQEGSKPENSLVDSLSEALAKPSFEDMRSLASSFYDEGPIIVSSCGVFGIVADRWRTELSENSKVIAKSEIYPESGHNDIVAWQASGERASFIVVEGPWEPECGRIMDQVTSVYSEIGPLVRYKPSSEDLPSAMLEAALAGGFFSIALALERNIDPLDTSIISRLKEALGEPVL